LSGIDGLRAVIAILDGIELPAAAWEGAVLPARLDRYDKSWLDMLCLTGAVAWGRLSIQPDRLASTGSKRQLRVALFVREHADLWQSLRFQDASAVHGLHEGLTATAIELLNTLRVRGASFLGELTKACGFDESAVRAALAELAAAGLVASDGFAGVRAVIRSMRHRPPERGRDLAGRWSPVPDDPGAQNREAAEEMQARVLLARYGIVFRRLLESETNAAPWRTLVAIYRRLEARGEIRGGRFVAGMSGEQFAVPEAVERLREVRRAPRDGRLITISAVDPLNLTGILTRGEKIRSLTSNRVVYREGVPLAVLEGDYLRPLTDIDPDVAGSIATALAGRPLPAVTSGFIGR
jgi:ATP-dependent Lhr-like helicase